MEFALLALWPRRDHPYVESARLLDRPDFLAYRLRF